MAETTWPWWRWVLVGCGGLVAIAALGGGAFAWWVISSSRSTVAQFDALVARTTPGTALAALLEDPFVARCALVQVTGAFAGEAELPLQGEAAVRAVLAEFRTSAASRSGEGRLHLMWVHLPPFGRLMLDVDYAAGAISAVRSGSLD